MSHDHMPSPFNPIWITTRFPQYLQTRETRKSIYTFDAKNRFFFLLKIFLYRGGVIPLSTLVPHAWARNIGHEFPHVQPGIQVLLKIGFKPNFSQEIGSNSNFMSKNSVSCLFLLPGKCFPPGYRASKKFPAEYMWVKGAKSVRSRPLHTFFLEV